MTPALLGYTFATSMIAPSPAAPERDRLFGLFAVQKGYVPATKVIEALGRATAERSLGELLQASAVISAEVRRSIDSLVEESLASFGGNPALAFQSLGGDAALASSNPQPSASAFESFGGDGPTAAPAPPAANRFPSFSGDAPAPPAAAASRFPSFSGDAPTPAATGGSRFPSISGDDPNSDALGATLLRDRSDATTPSRTARSTRDSHDGSSAQDGPSLLFTAEARGRYELRGELGKGGQSRVQVAFDHDISREIAFKELLPERRGNPSAVARFIREARITGQLEHPNIVPIYELARREDGSYYCAQKRVRGRTYGDALRHCKDLSDRLALLPHFAGICQAIAYAHSRGVVHRDLKPENVMVGEFGETVVLDWGLAKSRGTMEHPATTEDPSAAAPETAPPGVDLKAIDQTMVGSAIGTPAYMSPEQALGNPAEIDERSDVWSLGAILFETLTGRTPFEAETAFEMMGNVLRAPLPKVADVCPEAPRDLAAIAEKALTRDRAARYPNAKALADEIEAFRAGRRVTAYDYSSFELLKRFVAKNRVLSAIVLVSVALLSSAALVTYRRDRSSRQNLARAFVEKARAAERNLSWGESAVFRAAARTYDPSGDLPDGVSYDGAFEAHPLAQLRGHEAPIDFMAVSPTAPLLITGSRDRTVGFWDLAARKLIARVPAHPGSTDVAVAFSSTGKRCASIGDGPQGVLVIWDPETHAPIVTLPAPDRRPVLALSPDDDTVATFADGQIELWSIAARKVVRRWKVDEAVNTMAFVEAGKALVSGHANGALLLWNPSNGGLERRLPGHDQWITYLRLSRDGRWLTSASVDRKVGLWDTRSWSSPEMFAGHETTVTEADISPDDKLLASVDYDGAVRIWSATQHSALARLLVPQVMLTSVTFAQDGRTLIAASSDQTIRLWKLPTNTEAEEPAAARDASKRVLSADGRRIAFVGNDRSIGVWDSTSRRATRIETSAELIDDLVLSANGGRLAVRTPSKLTVYDSGSTRSLLEISDYPLKMLSSQLSDDGRLLAVGLADGRVLVYRIDGPPGVTPWNGQGGTATHLTFSPDDTQLAALYSDGSLHVWPLGGSSSSGRQAVPGGTLKFFTWGPDGAEYRQGDGYVLERIDPVSGSRRRFDGEAAPIVSLGLSHDRLRLFAASLDGKVHVWDATSGKVLAVLDHYWASVQSIIPLGDDSRFATIGSDGRIRRFTLVSLPPPSEQLKHAQSEFGLRLDGIELREVSVQSSPN